MEILLIFGIIVFIWWLMSRSLDPPIYREERKYYRSKGYKEVVTHWSGTGGHYWINDKGDSVPFGSYTGTQLLLKDEKTKNRRDR